MLYARTQWLPSLLTVLSPAPVLFVCLFLFFSDTKELVLPEDEVQASELAIPGRTPVVVMLFDEFQGTMLMDAKGQIDRSLFPNFAELADRGTWYPNATTEADLTPRAAPAVMTGSNPTHDQLPTAADHPNSIFTMLGSDYSMNVAEPVTSVCPESLCGERARPPTSERLDGLASDLRIVYEHLLLPESMEDSLPAVDEAFGGFGQAEAEQAEGELQSAEPADAGEAVAPTGADGSKQRGAVESEFDAPNASFLGRGNTFEEWLAEVSGRRTLNFVHLELPHVPYEFYPNGQRYAAGLLQTDGFRDSQGRNPEDPTISRLLEQRLLLQIGFTDYLLGKVIDRLKREGSWDDAIVAITADHGISLVPGTPRRVPNKANLAEIASVPLIVKGPGMPAGRTDDRQARTIDLLPTIAQLLDIPAPADTEGVSLLAPPPDRPEVRVEDRYQRVIVRSVPKFERDRDAVLAQKVALFGSRQGWASVYRAGPDGELVGRPSPRWVAGFLRRRRRDAGRPRGVRGRGSAGALRAWGDPGRLQRPGPGRAGRVRDQRPHRRHHEHVRGARRDAGLRGRAAHRLQIGRKLGRGADDRALARPGLHRCYTGVAGQVVNEMLLALPPSAGQGGQQREEFTWQPFWHIWTPVAAA